MTPGTDNIATQDLSAIESLDQDELVSLIDDQRSKEENWALRKLVAGGLAAFLTVCLVIFDVYEGGLAGLRDQGQQQLTLLMRQQAAAASKDAEEANAMAKGYEAQIAASKQGAEEARAKAAVAEERTAEIRKQLAPRLLDDSERLELAEDLRRFTSTLAGRPVTVSSYSADAEGIVFSLMILDILTQAGIETNPMIGRGYPLG